jgi:hypothetical protein
MPTKHCRGCDQIRDTEDFNWKDKNAGLRQSRCRLCTAKNSQAHYKTNKQAYIDRAHSRTNQIYKDNTQLLHEYLSTHPCVDCGCNDVRVLEFDHIQGKKKGDISRMVISSYSWTTISVEIAKCEVRCANCHRIKTCERGVFWRDMLQNNFSSDM